MPKKNVPKANNNSIANKVERRPQNPYGRQHMPEKASHVLMMDEGNSFSQEQFNMSHDHLFYRPLEQLQSLESLPFPDLKDISNSSNSLNPFNSCDLSHNENFSSPKRSGRRNSLNAHESSMSMSDSDMSSGSTLTPMTGSMSAFMSSDSMSTSASASADTSAQSSDLSLASALIPVMSPSLPFSPSRLPKVAFTPNGTKMTSKRHVRMSIMDTETLKQQQGAILFFSPERTKIKGRKRKQSPNVPAEPILNPEYFSSNTAFISNENTVTTKGGETTIIVPNVRDRKKAPSQKKIMGRSAREAMIESLSNGKDKYEADVLEKLKYLVNHADIEWCHRLGFSLAPQQFEPQHRDNLGAAPDYINSYMMVLEKLALYFSKLYPNAVSVMPLFKMLDDSDVIDEIEYEVAIKKEGKIITFYYKMPAFVLLDRSNWPSCSDSEQLKRVAGALLDEMISPNHKRMKV